MQTGICIHEDVKKLYLKTASQRFLEFRMHAVGYAEAPDGVELGTERGWYLFRIFLISLKVHDFED